MGDWVADAVVRQASMPSGSGGGSTMAGIIPAAIGGVASLGGAALGGKGAKQAAQAQAASQDKALAFAREQEAARRQDWQKAMDAYDARRTFLLQRYGIDVPAAGFGSPAAPQTAPGPVAPGPQAAPNSEIRGWMGGGGTLADILRSQ